MKKFLSISLLIIGSLYTDPYKPKPILFVHGRSGSQETWGIKPHKDRNPIDTIIEDSIIPGKTFDVFLNKMIPYIYTWWEYDHSYTRPEDTLTYPNKSFLEIWNADYPLGSIWQNDPNAKIILIADLKSQVFKKRNKK